MTSNLLGVSVTGLRVAQSNLNVTGHNIANAGVDGYSRQRVISETNPATMRDGGYIGNGVNVASIDRVVNSFITEQVRTDTSLYNDLEVYNTNIDQLDRMLSDAATGLSGSMESFFAAMQNGADDPTSIPARQLIISESENLSDKFQTLHARLDVINESVDDYMRSAVSQINSLSNNIAQFNQRISDAIGASGGGQPNDLLDQRDEAIRQLSELVGIQTYEQGFGQVNVVLSNGQNLVVGIDARELSLVTSQDDAQKLDVIFENQDNDIILTDTVNGGELGGLLRFQNSILDQTYNELGRIAVVMADSFNDLHRTGINLNNEFGGNFFSDVNDIVVARNRVVGHSGNSTPNDRTLSLNIADSSVITADDYQVGVGVGGLVTITNLGTGDEVASTVLTGVVPQTIAFEGLELVVESGTFRAGDSYKLFPVRSGSRSFSSEILNASSIAFGSPLVTDAAIGNVGSGVISPGEVLSLNDQNGNPLPLFATAGQMAPPLIVRFTSPTTYDILDNSDPGNPVDLVPSMRNQRYVVGGDNNLFSTDPGETLVQSNGDLIGLPAGRSPVVGGGALPNGYPSEAIMITRASGQAGVPDTSTTVFTTINASARETASLLSNVDGVSASASTYAEITNTAGLTRSSPLQINFNGEDLIEYEFDSGLGTFVVAENVPDPATDEDAFNIYLAERINSNENLTTQGIYAVAGVDATSGAFTLRVNSSEGDDLQITLEADGTGPDTLSIGDGVNTAVALSGNGPGTTSAIAVGGSIDVRMADGISFETFPSNSLMFGDTTASNFAQSTYLGIQASIQGVPEVGDTYTINFNADAASDNRNALLLSDMQNNGTMSGGVSFSDAYGSLVEDVGIETASSKTNRDASKRVLDEVIKLRDSVSGVNLDEEAANLIRYEQMFSANAQVISVARDLFERLINTF